MNQISLVMKVPMMPSSFHTIQIGQPGQWNIIFACSFQEQHTKRLQKSRHVHKKMHCTFKRERSDFMQPLTTFALFAVSIRLRSQQFTVIRDFFYDNMNAQNMPSSDDSPWKWHMLIKSGISLIEFTCVLSDIMLNNLRNSLNNNNV